MLGSFNFIFYFIYSLSEIEIIDNKNCRSVFWNFYGQLTKFIFSKRLFTLIFLKTDSCYLRLEYNRRIVEICFTGIYYNLLIR